MNARSKVLAAAAAGLALILAGCFAEEDRGMTSSEALERLGKLEERIELQHEIVQQGSQLAVRASSDLADALPRLDEYPLTVDARAVRGARNAVIAEVCSSSEKAGKDTDGWLNEMANKFNRDRHRTRNGAPALVAIRKIASGTCEQYIASGRYVPDAYTPSNVLWVRMLKAKGVKMTKIAESLVGNVAGIVMRDEIARKIEKQHGRVDVASIIEAVASDEIAMGYTNPYASSTGLNLLQTVLATYAGGDETRMLDDDVVSSFVAFQQGVPFIALTTIQMRDAVGQDENRGSLDAFVMEHQTFKKVEELSRSGSGWRFVPFGIRHDNPLYAIGDFEREEIEVAALFAKYLLSDASQAIATRYGFNDPGLEDYEGVYEPPDGQVLIGAQQLWKEKKDAGRPVIGLFVVDVSGSMAGKPIARVRDGLKRGAEFIAPGNIIGLMAFNRVPRLRVEPKAFGASQRNRFLRAVSQLSDGGGTGMHDAVVAAIRIVLDTRDAMGADNPAMASAKAKIFVLSDGETTSGYGYSDVKDMVRGVGIPIYTIAYGRNAAREELANLSKLAEGAALSANEGKVEHLIASMLNAQM